MNALHHFLEHPQLRSRVKNLLMDTLLNTLHGTFRPLGACQRDLDISNSECNFSEETLILSKIDTSEWAIWFTVSWSSVRLSLWSSFAEIVRIASSKKKKILFGESNADLNQAGTGSENNSDSLKIALIAPPSELPSKKNKALSEPRKASAEVELQRSPGMTTSPLKVDQERTSLNLDLKGTREAQTFRELGWLLLSRRTG
jgi:hypothetical protein